MRKVSGVTLILVGLVFYVILFSVAVQYGLFIAMVVSLPAFYVVLFSCSLILRGGFKMVNEELSWEDTNHLYKLCVIPTLVVFYITLIYFVYLMRTDSMKTIWDLTIRVGWLLIFMPAIFFIAFEVLYHRKITKPLRFHLKRFTGRMLPTLASALSYFGFLIVAELIFSPIVGDRAFLVGSILWLVIFIVVVLRFKRFVGKLDKGEW